MALQRGNFCEEKRWFRQSLIVLWRIELHFDFLPVPPIARCRKNEFTMFLRVSMLEMWITLASNATEICGYAYLFSRSSDLSKDLTDHVYCVLIGVEKWDGCFPFLFYIQFLMGKSLYLYFLFCFNDKQFLKYLLYLTCYKLME